MVLHIKKKGTRNRNGVLSLVVLALSLFAAFAACTSKEGMQEANKPNLLFIITDDQGYGDISCYGGSKDVLTPHFDALAKSGVRFTNAYVTMSICSPSRMSMLTGRQQQRWGVYNYGAKLPDQEITLGEQLQANGYTTGLIGKSHMGPVSGPGHPEFPLSHGFDYFFGKEGGTMDYLRHTLADREFFSEKMANHLGIGPFWNNTKQVDMQGYSTDIILDKTLEYIDKHKSEPFFLTVSFNAVHLFTHQIPKEDLEQMGMDEVPDWNPKTGDWDAYLEWYVNTVKPNTPQGRKRYLYHLDKLDAAIGQITKKLEQAKIDKNTIVVFVSDNGGSPRTYANNSPLKGNKYILEEGGIRVPLIIRWPPHIKAGSVYDKPISGLDLFPTLHAALHIDLPKDLTLDGKNLLPYLSGTKHGSPHEWLFWTGFQLKGKPLVYEDPNGPLARHDRSYNGDITGWAVRYKNWKLRYYGRTAEFGLYDLENDVSEKHNLADEHPELIKQMSDRFFEWHEEIKKDQKNYVLPESSEF